MLIVWLICSTPISIHALLAESDRLRCCFQTGPAISIHALLAESDFQTGPAEPCVSQISIHALLAESDCVSLLFFKSAKLFLSTLSLRRATSAGYGGAATSRDFYPRSPCGERRSPACIYTLDPRDFYPRSPCGERRMSIDNNRIR